jgi:hypothetical protein
MLTPNKQIFVSYVLGIIFEKLEEQPMAGKWQSLASPPSVPSGAFSAETMLLLTNGNVLIHNAYQSEWLLFKPDPNNGYAGGSWGAVSQMSTQRGFFASGVLRDGRVFVVGGETSTSTASDISSGDIYDPATNTWTAMAGTNAPPAYIQGDASACVLPDGRVLFGAISSNQTAVWDPLNSSWTAAGTAFGTQGNSKFGNCNEETWTLLPDGSVITVNTKAPAAGGGLNNSPTSAERYIPATDLWQQTSALPNVLALTSLTDNATNPPTPAVAYEIGPAILLPSGKFIAFGATGHTAIYDPTTDTWTAGPDFPADPGDPSNNNVVISPTGLLTLSDAPACLQPNGRVLTVAGTLYLTVQNGQNLLFSKNSQYFEYDPVANKLSKLTAQPPSAATSQDTWTARFLLLPTGQILLSTQQGQVYIYTPDSAEGSYQPAWQPAITSFPNTLVTGHSYLLTGTQLNGLSQANSYGDDAQMATNYPIVQLTDTVSKAVYYLQTQDFSSLGVAVPGNQTCSVTVPSNIPPGAYSLVVIACGIPSAPQQVEIGTVDLSFQIEESSFGGGQVQAQINSAGAPAVFPKVLYVQAEGCTLAQCGISGSASLSAPTNQPTVTSPDPRIVFTYAGQTAVEDLTNPGPQRIQFPFQVSFKDASIFSDPAYFPADTKRANITISAKFTPLGGSPLSAQASIELTQTPNPFILHNDPSVEQDWYLSQDLRVFQVVAGTSYLGVQCPNTGDPISDATTYISNVIAAFNSDRSAADTLFNGLSQDEGDTSQLTLAPTDASNRSVFNFALVRVRTQDVAPAKDVRVFFRMWAAQQTDALYDPNTIYASRSNGSEKIPVLGVQNDQIITIPFFATPRVDASTVSMATQQDTPNVQSVIAPDPLGAEVHTFFGCWLDINQPTTQPGAQLFPPVVFGDAAGPFSGPLLPIQSFAKSDHQCLIAEISYDVDPIPTGADPASSDKLAQRNLTFVNAPNPGQPPSRIAPQTFEVRPSPARLRADRKPDELRFDFSQLPHGCIATVYLPAAESAEILDWATRLYTTHRLTAIDAHTIRMPANGTGWLPIPQGGPVNFAGLLTIEFPPGIRKGQKFEVPVSQITSVGGSYAATVGVTQIQAAARVHDTATKGAARGRAAHQVMAAAPAAMVQMPPWRRTRGCFRLTVPVLTKHDILPEAERLLSIFLWTAKTIPVLSRWRPVFDRYLEQLKTRLSFLGGDPAKIIPSPTGNWHGGSHEGGHGHEPDADSDGVYGKIVSLAYNHFGDFEGFEIETESGHRRFFVSRERRVEELARRACEERFNVVVFPLPERHEIRSLRVHEAR